MSDNIARQPKGRPTGGQFAATTKSESGLDSLSADVDWGSTGVGVGSNTPWGSADHAETLADGITLVSTASHGGIKLSPERNRMVPGPLRQRSGWYEEDCQASVVNMVFADDLPELASHADAEQSVKDWFPDEYEAAFGTTLAPGESMTRDRQLREAAQHDQFVTRSALGSIAGNTYEGYTIPEGKVLVSARRASDGVESHFLVDTEVYRARGDAPYVVNPETDVEITEIEDARRAKRQEAIAATRPVTTLVGKPSARLDKALDQRWRDSETGRVYSLRGDIEAGRFHAKFSAGPDSKKSYYLCPIADDGGPSSILVKVPKSVFDAYAGPISDD